MDIQGPLNRIRSFQKDRGAGGPAAGSKLRPGQVLQGTVLRKYPGGEMLISSGGKSFLARTTIDLDEGRMHRFEVKSLGAKIELKVLAGASRQNPSPRLLWASGREGRQKLSGILLNLSSGLDLKGLPSESVKDLSRLAAFLPSILYNRPEGKKTEWISRHLLRSGIFWENKVAEALIGKTGGTLKRMISGDLKGLLLSLEKSLSAIKSREPEAESLLLRSREAIHLIEQDQWLNISSLEENLGWFWYIPGREDDGFQQAEMFAERNGDGDLIHLSMILDFSRLGEMEVGVTLAGTLLGVNIFVEDQDRVDFLSSHLPLLKEGLQAAGMKIGRLSCEIKADDPGQPFFFTGARGNPSSVHLVI